MTPTIEEVKRVALDNGAFVAIECVTYSLKDGEIVLTKAQLQAFAQHYIEEGIKVVNRDAKRWQYTQQEGYFICGPYSTDGDFMGYSVGVKPKIPANLHWKELPKYGNIAKWTKGRGETIEEAIDEAIRNNTGE